MAEMVRRVQARQAVRPMNSVSCSATGAISVVVHRATLLDPACVNPRPFRVLMA
ncbi:MAG: hypothetical protein RL722_428 [Pseudomonadota bacterium]|jgi:hypothetical protein